MLDKYKAVIFDLDNTLLDYDLSERSCMKQALGNHLQHEQLEWDEFWAVFGPINLKYWMDRIHNNHSIDQVLEHSFTDTFRQLKREAANPRELTETYWNLFCGTCHLEPNADILINSLHGKYSLGILSNGIGSAQRKRLETGGLIHHFDALVISDEVHCWKPDRQIFELMLKELKVRPEEALYIGDSLRDDYEGARGAGIDFCLYRGRDQVLEAHQKPTYVIEDLLELAKVLSA